MKPILPLRAVALVLVGAALLVLVPFWPWIVLALWFGLFARRFLGPFTRLTGGRHRAAALLTVALVTSLVLLLAIVVVPLGAEAVDFARRLGRSEGGRSTLEALVAPSGTGANFSVDVSSIRQLVETHGTRAWSVLKLVAGATSRAVLGLVIFVFGAYASMVDGPAAFSWLERQRLVEAAHLRRFANAFAETGRGLFVGIVGTGLAQSAIATTMYLVLGVPRAIVLGVLTLFASIIPGVGTAVVWVPVAAGLALTGRPIAAVVLALVGVFIIGIVDNVLRPILVRHGKLKLPTYVVMISMLGGFALVGASGLLLGPLIVRLAIEAVTIAGEEQAEAA